MALSGPQQREFRDALVYAFPTWPELEAMLRFELGESLYNHAGPGGMKAVTFNLLVWAEAQGRMQDLLDGAVRANSHSLT